MENTQKHEEKEKTSMCVKSSQLAYHLPLMPATFLNILQQSTLLLSPLIYS